MPALYLVVGFLVVQRVAETVLDRRNQRALAARGAIEFRQPYYRALVALHVGWLLALLATIDPRTPVSLPLLAMFALLECGRVWVIATLGSRWTTRLLVLPGAARIRSGPYRYLDHPNYLIVCGEMAVVPLMFDAWGLAVCAVALYLPLLRMRLRDENAALAQACGGAAPASSAEARGLRPGV